jgi:hypothetical protein
LALLGFACLYTYRLEVPETRTKPAAAVERLWLETANGGVEVAASSDSLAHVLVKRYAWGKDSADAARAIGNVVVTDSLSAGTWTITADMPSGSRPYGAAYSATCPAKTGIAIRTTNGGVDVSGMTGGVTVSTTSGAVHLTGTEGRAEVTTTNGAVSVQVHRGPVALAATNGAVACDLALLHASENATLSTTNGAVSVQLPPDVSATVDVTTTNGEITISGFAQIQYLEQTRTRVRARIGSGASSVTVTTTNAAISISPRS